MIVKLLTERHLEFLSLIGGCRGLSKSPLGKMSNCWKSHTAAQLNYTIICIKKAFHSLPPDNLCKQFVGPADLDPNCLTL